MKNLCVRSIIALGVGVFILSGCLSSTTGTPKTVVAPLRTPDWSALKATLPDPPPSPPDPCALDEVVDPTTGKCKKFSVFEID